MESDANATPSPGREFLRLALGMLAEPVAQVVASATADAVNAQLQTFATELDARLGQSEPGQAIQFESGARFSVAELEADMIALRARVALADRLAAAADSAAVAMGGRGHTPDYDSKRLVLAQAADNYLALKAEQS